MTNTKNIYQLVNEKILDSLNQGIIPWQKPWIGTGNEPFNIVSSKSYSMLNSIMLQKGGAYATLKQWNSLGGKVRKGSKSCMICFWKMFRHLDSDSETGEVTDVVVPMLRYYNVFHIDDVEFNPDKIPNKVRKFLESLNAPIQFDHERIELADAIMNSYIDREKITLVEGDSDQAFYQESLEKVSIPKLSQFQNRAEYYSTKAHELTHSTGSAKRLKRDMSGKFGSKKYAREELVAEMGASYFCNLIGAENDASFKNNVAYIQSWMQAIKNDERCVIVAAGKAEKATQFILDNKSIEEWDRIWT